ncbi:MarR family winged helix-turn-helix transcriptional regulator [Eremococcus coleocola]|uniref:Transcriptional regulator, MarR family n=1 Tax=Eremococcus coleocola ACS-139-V-Col8 TaxID=908337 RepID=E4KQ02_9LACT|nr:MarR family winged helix-turn-helix transcriptional regulator [Eremococcus coleocola]EFR31075.1 transcriptional regulator, MarR family [Eremococcus coleocola ACS-139-V-Col8]
MDNLAGRLAKNFDLEHLDGPQGHVVSYLGQHQAEDVFQKDIEAELEISKSVASQLVQRMERNGFIEVVPYDKDRRYKCLRLTGLGQEKLPIIKDFSFMIENFLFEGISKAELDQVIKVFNQLSKNIEKVNHLLDQKEETQNDTSL